MGLDYPHGHWLINIAAALLFVVAPVWTLWIGLRLGQARRCPSCRPTAQT